MTRSFRSIPTPAGVLVIAALTGWIASPGVAAEEHHQMIPVEEVTFQPGPPTLPEGAQIAVLMGNPAEEGAFVIRLKFPAGFVVPPHYHSKEEHLTVISGRFEMSMGEAFDEAGATALMPGGFVRIPAGQPHAARAGEETVVQLNSIGPFDIIYMDEADDPRIN